MARPLNPTGRQSHGSHRPRRCVRRPPPSGPDALTAGAAAPWGFASSSGFPSVCPPANPPVTRGPWWTLSTRPQDTESLGKPIFPVKSNAWRALSWTSVDAAGRRKRHYLAEGGGFEPPKGVNPYTLSRRATSTAHPTLRNPRLYRSRQAPQGAGVPRTQPPSSSASVRRRTSGPSEVCAR